jgi:hypothetical protein
MRRTLAAAAIAIVLPLAAACSAERADTAAPVRTAVPDATAASGAGPSTAGAAPAVTAPAGGNAKEVCAAARKATAESVTTFIGELGKMLEATGAKNTKAVQTAQKNAEAALAAWSTAMKEQAARATDAQLKATLDELGAEVAKIKPDVNTLDGGKLDQLQQRLDQLCAG